MLGVAVNSIAVVVGSLLGLLFKKGIGEKLSSAVMVGVGLCTIYIGIDGLGGGVNPIVAVVAIVIGVIVGTIIDIDRGMNRLGDLLSKKLSKNGENNFTKGFVSASLLFCVGAMAIVGSIESGLTNNHTTLFTKSILDFVSAIMFASSFGIGTLFSIIPLTIYQGAIAICAGFLDPVLTDGAISAISCTGSVVIMGLGLNIAGVSNFKIANFIPAIFFSPFIFYLFELIL